MWAPCIHINRLIPKPFSDNSLNNIKTVLGLIIKRSNSPIENHQTHDTQKRRKQLPTIRLSFAFLILVSMLEPFARGVKARARFVRDLLLGTSGGGTPFKPLLASSGHSWSEFVDSLEDCGSKFAPEFKDSRATNCTSHTFRKTSKDSNKLY